MHLVYTSRAVVPFTADDLHDLLTRSRRNNHAAGLTGMLLYKQRHFLQVLEGEDSVVDGLYERIVADPRHTQAVVLLRETLAERQFAEWSMGFRDLDAPESASLPGYTNFLNQPLTPESFAGDLHRSLWLLLVFRQNAA